MCFVYSCATEPEENSYNIYFQNEANVELEIISFFNNVMVDSIMLENTENMLHCSYSNLSFQGYTCYNQADSIIFRFSNNRGNISTVIYSGDVVGIIGKTGSGKSTFIDLLMGLLKPTKGEFKINDINPNVR